MYLPDLTPHLGAGQETAKKSLCCLCKGGCLQPSTSEGIGVPLPVWGLLGTRPSISAHRWTVQPSRTLQGPGVARAALTWPRARAAPAMSASRPKPRATQNGTFGQGAMVPGFGSDDTAQGGLLSPWGAYRGQLWAAPPT